MAWRQAGEDFYVYDDGDIISALWVERRVNTKDTWEIKDTRNYAGHGRIITHGVVRGLGKAKALALLFL